MESCVALKRGWYVIAVYNNYIDPREGDFPMLSNGLTKILMVTVMAAFASACATDEQMTTDPTPADETGMPVNDTGVIDEKPMMDGGPVAGSQDDLIGTAGDRVFFEFDSSELSGIARGTLRAQAEWLNTNAGVNVTIEGHADERGTREYNLALGERRATAVKNYLVALGVSAGRVSTLSYGKERPDCGAQNEDCWARNRRGVMTVNAMGM